MPDIFSAVFGGIQSLIRYMIIIHIGMFGSLGQTYANAGAYLKGQILLRAKRFKDSFTDIFNKIRTIAMHECSKLVTAKPENDVIFPKHILKNSSKYL